MLKVENVEVLGWEHAIRGMRNPKNSWEKSDSNWRYVAPSQRENHILASYSDDSEFCKNHDYGDSFHTTFVEEGLAMARIRLGDKFSRFKTLSRLSCNDRDQQQVTDESIRDTLLDLANYAIMTVLEMDTPDESHATLYAYDKPIYTVEEDK